MKVEVYFGEGRNNGHKKEDPLIDEDYAKTCLDLTNSDSEVKMNLHGGKDRKKMKKPSKHTISEAINFEIRMITSRVIEVGEELSFDYGPLYSPSNGWMGSVSL